jgi:hypothetical protein
MTEWILILTFNLISPQGAVRDISPVVISGFSSKKSCSTASYKISYELIGLTGKMRNAQGLTKRGHKSEPRINSKCLKIEK